MFRSRRHRETPDGIQNHQSQPPLLPPAPAKLEQILTFAIPVK